MLLLLVFESLSLDLSVAIGIRASLKNALYMSFWPNQKPIKTGFLYILICIIFLHFPFPSLSTRMQTLAWLHFYLA